MSSPFAVPDICDTSYVHQWTITRWLGIWSQSPLWRCGSISSLVYLLWLTISGGSWSTPTSRCWGGETDGWWWTYNEVSGKQRWYGKRVRGMSETRTSDQASRYYRWYTTPNISQHQHTSTYITTSSNKHSTTRSTRPAKHSYREICYGSCR